MLNSNPTSDNIAYKIKIEPTHNAHLVKDLFNLSFKSNPPFYYVTPIIERVKIA